MNLGGIEHHDVAPRRCAGAARSVASHDNGRRVADRARLARPSRLPTRGLPDLHRLGRARGAHAGARPDRRSSRERPARSACTCRGRSRSSPGTGTCCVRPGGARRSAAVRCSTSIRSCPRTRARPDRSVDRVIAERGWIEVDRARATHRRAPTGDARALGRCARTRSGRCGEPPALGDRRAPARSASTWRRSTNATARVLEDLADVAVDGGRARPGRAADPLAAHPFVAALEAAPFTPPAPTDVHRDELRRLVQRGLVIEQDGMYFAPSAVEAAGTNRGTLLADQPEGVTVAEAREALGTSRKWAIPLARSSRRHRRHPPPGRCPHRRAAAAAGRGSCRFGSITYRFGTSMTRIGSADSAGAAGQQLLAFRFVETAPDAVGFTDPEGVFQAGFLRRTGPTDVLGPALSLELLVLAFERGRAGRTRRTGVHDKKPASARPRRSAVHSSAPPYFFAGRSYPRGFPAHKGTFASRQKPVASARLDGCRHVSACAAPGDRVRRPPRGSTSSSRPSTSTTRTVAPAAIGVARLVRARHSAPLDPDHAVRVDRRDGLARLADHPLPADGRRREPGPDHRRHARQHEQRDAADADEQGDPRQRRTRRTAAATRW